jgi:4-amino-4-deoxy-L-arabinose transferase-like glycosyltransferase
VPSVSGATTEYRDGTIALGVLLVAALVRLILGAVVPLVPDETYYWEWSRRLAPGYLDHPPAIAFLVRGGTALLGDTPLGVRLLPQAAGLIAMFACVRLAALLGGPVAARRAALVTVGLPVAAIGLIVATPDAPLVMMAALTLLATVQAVRADWRSRSSLRWWLVAGGCLGLAFDSKYTAVLLPLGALVAMLSHRDLRPHLARPGPYVAGVVAIAMTTPVVVWNSRHDWASFAFQLHHGLGTGRGSPLLRELDYVGAIALLATPILFVLLAVAVGRAVARRLRPDAYLLGIIATTWVVFFAYTSLRHRPEPNWAAPALLAAVPLLAVSDLGARAVAWLRRGIVLGVAVTIVGYAGLAFPSALPVTARHALARIFDWDPLALGVTIARSELARSSWTADARPNAVRFPWIAAERYQLASELAFRLTDRPTVFALNFAGRPNQYDYWPGFPERGTIGDDLLLVLEERPESRLVVATAQPYFESVSRVESGIADGHQLWHLHRWRGGWPRQRPRP